MPAIFNQDPCIIAWVINENVEEKKTISCNHIFLLM